jgi:hypothetical protein
MNEGKKDRRDPIRTIKTKNPVAKAHQNIGSGSGAHKDKKKAMKQGEVKHKKAEYAEQLEMSLKKALEESEQQYNTFRVGQRATFKNSRGQEFPVIITATDYDDEAVKFKSAENKPFPNGELEIEVDPGWRFLTPDRTYNPNSLVRATSRESFDAEYDDEAGMADNNLETLERAVQGIDDLISAGDNLPEWCQEKIAVAKSMLVTVWDYMKSEEERGVAEGLRDPKDNPCWKGYKPVGTKKKGGRTVPNCVPKESKVNELNKSTLGSYVKKAGQDIVDRSSSASFKSGAAGDKYNKADTSDKEARREKGIDRALSKLTKESQWTHDSLAARLFETENTYEDYLKNLLSKKLGK